ncbi:hypothetical protein BKA70DRAFT_1443242 [Coprinopsis sp. MPI-PUGE-AT-0042]|nr:hypothetical protein BKA70DRAFT_1443242 [Coprinopsis sp. MPI-PUGE-AT-0042]
MPAGSLGSLSNRLILGISQCIMVHRWTDNYKGSLDFLSNLLPDYVAAQENKTGLKDKFYPMVTAKFKERFPQVPTEAEIVKYGKEQAQEVVDKKLFNRIRQWFPNNTRPGSRACQVKEETPSPQSETSRVCQGRQKYSKSCIRIMPAARVLHPIQAYQKLFYKGSLKEEYTGVREAYLTQCEQEKVTPIHPFTHRNQWLKEQFDRETETVKAQVEDYRMNENKQAPDEDNEASSNARYARSIPKVPKTLEGICESISKETGWSVSIIVGGPHPTYGGRIATLSRHFGRTPDGRSFDEFLGKQEYARQVALFDDFLLESFDENKRKELTIDNKTGPVVYDNDSDDEDGDNDDEVEIVDAIDQSPSSTKKANPDQTSTTKSASTQPKKSAVGQLSEYKMTKQMNITKNAALLQELGLSGGASKQIGLTGWGKGQGKSRGNKLVGQTSSGSGDHGSSHPNASGSKEARSSASSPPGSPPTDAASKSTTPSPNPPSQTTTSAISNAPTASLAPATALSTVISQAIVDDGSTTDKAHDQGQQVVDTTTSVPNVTNEPMDVDPSSAKDTSNNVGSEDTISEATSQASAERGLDILKANDKPSGKCRQEAVTQSNYPIPPHVNSLWEYLLNLSECERWRELLQGYLKFEVTAPPFGSMPTTMRPSEVASWMKRHRKAETPKDIDVDDFEQRLLAWWHSLQPAWRISSATSAPSMYKRDNTAGDLDGLRKGGPNGIVLVIIAIGWWISSHRDKLLGGRVDEVLEDLIWVLGKVSNNSSGPSGANDAGGRPKREKHKNEGVSVTTKHPRRA